MILLALAAATAAQPALDCDNAYTQSDMNQCAWIEYEAADAALNAQWAETAAAMKRMDAGADTTYDDGRPGYFDQLLAAQRVWLKYRDEHCASEGYLARGGSMEPLLVSTCKTDLTEKRTKELRELTEWGN